MTKLCWLNCLTVVTLAVFFGIFFGINYPEIKRAEYIPTMCQCLSATIVPRFCCNLNCNNTCSDTSILGLPQCESLMSQSQSLSPIACSENSTFCPKSGLNAYCDNGYYCCSFSNDDPDPPDPPDPLDMDPPDMDPPDIPDTIRKRSSCDKSTDHQGCQMICNRCYNVELNLTYYVGQHQQNLIYVEDFSKSLDNANIFLSTHDQNSTFQCYYNPSSVTDIIFDRNFTKWKWILFAFPAFALFLCLVTLTNLILHYCCHIEEKTWRWSIVSIIWIGAVIPLIILLQVWQYGLVSKTGLIVLMVFIFLFIAFGSLPIVMKFLIFCGFSLLQAISLSFIGLIIPLVVYVSIILYVPSSNTIIFSILVIQLTSVLLAIICKLKGIDLMIVKHIMYL